ncbi:uncharacterized protein LOC126380883 [Pectinophora gossypiella]|uniref:uncharacterized protein LOC126380883 n=1 Tax=Pectinophora gossypiella TaxID=13191 RepID=UPI00214EB83D|nr:uncharacterized protein LOC126380883 [Pectinophora gossypiella]
MTNFLKDEGLLQLETEPCIFKNKEETIYLGIHVDDGIIIGKSEEAIDKLLRKIGKRFQTKINKNPDKYIGMEIIHTKRDLKLKQEKFIENLLEDYNMKDAKIIQTPMETIKREKSDKNITFPYRQLLGSLTYISNKTRPDISFAVNQCSRNVENPTENDVTTIKRILRYLKGTKDKGLEYKKEEKDLELTAYCDFDYAVAHFFGIQRHTGSLQVLANNDQAHASSPFNAEYCACDGSANKRTNTTKCGVGAFVKFTGLCYCA